MFVEANQDEPVIERVAALDIGKAEIVCCIRLPAGGKEGADAGDVDLLDDSAVVVRAGEPVGEAG